MLRKVFLFLVILFFIGRPVLANGVEYLLPWPGILPDNPLYVLKVVRDNVVETLVREPRQKAFYFLFLSDKRLAAGQQLVVAKKISLGETTILQSQEYYTRAVDLALGVKDNDLVSKIIVSGAKHEEIITALPPSKNLQKAFTSNQNDKDRVTKLLIKE